MKSSSPLKIGRSRIYQYLAAVTANLGIICSEMHYGWPSPFSPILLEEGRYKVHITKTVQSWLTVIPLIGAIFGAFFTGLLVDIFGRKRMIVFSSLPFIISWLLIGFAESSVLMFVGRFLAGMADGLSFTAVPMYIGEMAEPQIRGLLASVCPVFIIFGILLINILGTYIRLDTVAFIATIIPTLLLVTFPWMPESPYFYLMKGNVDEARKSLQIFRGTEDVGAELERMSKAVKEQEESKGSYLDLFRVKSNRKAMIITLGLRGFQQLTGTTVVIFYCKTIFQDAGVFSASIATMIYFSVQLVLSAISSFVVDFSGRKPLLIISIIGTGISLLANSIYLYLLHLEVDMSDLNFVPLIALLGFVITFSIGMQTIPLLIMGEVFPTSVKAYALCTMDMYYSIIVTCISQFFDWTSQEFGLYIPFFVFTASCVLALMFIIYFVPETKGKTLEDIQEELQGKKRVIDRKSVDNMYVY